MKALIIVDIQHDFLPGGALAVPHGDEIIPVVNKLQTCFDLVVMTQDFHPQNHGSFASNHPGKNVYEMIDLNGLPQVLWPDHCVETTKGADFPEDLDTKQVAAVFQKGTDPQVDSYSGFFDNGRKKDTGMGGYLRSKGVKSVYVCGLATDYCVKATAIDAHSLGFETFFVQDASRGVNLNPGDVDAAIEDMKREGITVIDSEKVLSPVVTV